MAHPYFVDIDPIAFSIGPLEVHWYGVMYLLAFALCWWLGERRRKDGYLPVAREPFVDLAFYVMLGVIIGGRLGYMLFYGTPQLIAHPLSIVKIWQGGMSFHGGLIGVLIASLWWTRKNKLHYFDVVDFVAPLVPIGLGLGRLGNFIGGELWGRYTSMPWGMIYPRALEANPHYANLSMAQLKQLYASGALDAQARHPSELYEFILEGVVLFLVLWFFSARPRHRYATSGLFALLYGVFRFGIEFVRQPDAQLGFIAFHWLTMGQILSLPLIAVGLLLLWMSRRAPVPAFERRERAAA
ncbi:MAG TPA: prolipoprotein diacylglyceryl transferase [Rhodanobacteraceae bacterium]|nr:prolipoprotein diacylglyceryl transferase [Rhodanobacteraceae bacterium]